MRGAGPTSWPACRATPSPLPRANAWTGRAHGRLPWLATLTPAELAIARSHGLRPVAAVSATCWMHYGWSWTEGHAQGWHTALTRLRAEAVAAGANAVLDVKMRTVPLGIESSMDFTLVGTAAYVEGLPPSTEPIVATVPALEFVKLLDAEVVPTGMAVGAKYDWLTDWQQQCHDVPVDGQHREPALGGFWREVRRDAHAELRRNAQPQGNGVLAHVNFSQMFEFERNERKRVPRRATSSWPPSSIRPPARSSRTRCGSCWTPMPAAHR